jgi:hypothetical protein
MCNVVYDGKNEKVVVSIESWLININRLKNSVLSSLFGFILNEVFHLIQR